MTSEQPDAVDPTRIVPPGFVFPGTEQLHPREVFAGPGYQAPRQRTDPTAVGALACAILSPIPGLGLVALILGCVALRRLRSSYDTGHGQAWFAIVVGAAVTVGWLWLWWLITQTT
ncbi:MULTISPECIES: DUF4190 domain-containing protein [Actinomyces]|uniref:DUF4190 domain-containing protein n=1 Tax=Actinomyces glycerinitolerans TaxID=1892869 RepID=A0A1M4RYY8_9ACTO|nr:MULTISPECIES: DUF4190 domain-containing protein [Actinomyces]RAX20002.1 DUF4190 domain-containing protein [Actinomyces sp. Z5]RAX22472.1 DUF4190 domain-containing protein [Actinomyces sp. Z3]SHE25168.1 Hypothetical protein ACGLYG10_1383 [Actinomyces glycerinitolerans]